jgi:uncharacterized protein YjbI with pentapeptide repeats
MNNLRRWTEQLVAIVIFLLAAFATGQDSSQQPSCTWEFDGALPEEQRTIQADEISECIKAGVDVTVDAGVDVTVDNAVIQGVLDLTTLKPEEPEFEDDPHNQVIYIRGKVSITNSRFDSDFNSGFSEGEVIPIIFKQDADFSSTTFAGTANFSDMTFVGDADFSSTNFSGNADFSNPTFTGNADFSYTTFSGDAKFMRTTFSGYANFLGAKFSEDAGLTFIDAIFSGYANFRYATFSGYANFWYTIFTGTADFSYATFSGDADFSSTTFSGGAGFIRTTFSGETNFFGMNFSFASLPRYSFFYDLVSLDGQGYPIYIYNDAVFYGATFSKNADFSSITFRNVDFSYTDFHGEFRLDSASVSGNACFINARFTDLASFWQFKVPFSKTVFTSSRFDGKVILDVTEFKDIDFSPHADLSICEIQEKTVFPPAAFFDQVNFRNSKMGKANFQETYFTDLNLSGSTFDTLLFTDTLYNRLFYSGSTTNFYKALQKGFDVSGSTAKQEYDALDKLRTNFKGFGQISMTNEAYYQKSILERSYDPETETKPEWNKLGFWGKVGLAWNYISFYISGYFVKPQWAFWGSWLFIIFFGLIYFLVDTISLLVSKKDSDKNDTLNPLPWQTITDEKQREAAWFEVARQLNTQPIKKKRTALSIIKLLSQKFWNSLLFSFSKFTKVKLDRTPDKRIYWLETIEWIIGAVMLASLIISIANSVPGLERIVGAILPG